MRRTKYQGRSTNRWARRNSFVLRPSSFRRRGVTIMEVLFAIMVTGIGLTAALTLLPVAATQARKARTADASSSAVTAAVGYFDAMGMRKPQNWIAYNMGTGTPRYPWAEFQAGTASWFDGSQSFCIDPRMIAANLQNQVNPLLGVTGTTLPPGGRSGATTFPRNIVYGPNQPAMWRLSLYSGLNGPGPAFAPLPLPKLMADSAFVFDDDLNYDRAADASLVSSQVLDYLPGAATTPARRQREGHLAWMATLVPKLDRYVGVTSNIRPLINTYVLSVVVFYDRPANLVYNADPLNERVLNVAAMPGGGVTGGEVLLRTTGNPVDQQDADKQLNVHTNEWIMLMGTLPSVQIGIDPVSSNPVFTDPVHVFKWYRVSDIEAEVTWPGPGNPAERYITLMGQDWIVPLANTQAVAMEGVVAVVEKTIRLEP